jgi:hypothetical protein
MTRNFIANKLMRGARRLAHLVAPWLANDDWEGRP